MLLTRDYKQLRFNVYWVSAIASVILCLILFAYQQPINVDGVIYLNAAHAFNAQGLRAAFSQYAWPFYSILFGGLAQFTKLSLIQGAYLLNTVLSMITVLTFVACVQALGGRSKEQWVAAGLILFYPYLTHAKDALIREQGYLPFILLALFFFLRFVSTLRMKDAMAWGGLILLAALFRIEAVAFLLLLPLTCLLIRTPYFIDKIKAVFLAYSVPVIVFAGAFVYLVYEKHFNLQDLGRLQEIIFQLQSGGQKVLQSFQQTTTQFKLLLGPDTRGSIGVLLFSGLIGVFVVQLISVLTPWYAFLSIYAAYKKLLPAPRIKYIVLFWAMFINLLVIALFLGQHFFLTGRYVLFLSILFLLFVPFAITHLYDVWQRQRRPHSGYTKVLSILLVCCFIYTFFASIGHFGPSKTYIKKTGQWVALHTSSHSRLYTNEPQLLIYAQRSGVEYPRDFKNGRDLLQEFFTTSSVNGYDVFAFKIKRHQTFDLEKIETILKSSPVQQFKNRQGDQMVIFLK